MSYFLVFQEFADGPFSAETVSGPEPTQEEYDQIIGEMAWGHGVYEAGGAEAAIELALQAQAQEREDRQRAIDQRLAAWEQEQEERRQGKDKSLWKTYYEIMQD